MVDRDVGAALHEPREATGGTGEVHAEQYSADGERRAYIEERVRVKLEALRAILRAHITPARESLLIEFVETQRFPEPWIDG